METKHIIALILFFGAGCVSILATTFSQRLRDLAFLGMVCFSIFAEKFDVNFFGEYWYRGTSRGMGLSITDVLAWSILIATYLTPRYPNRKWFVPASTSFIFLYFLYGVWATINAQNPRFATWELVNIPRGFLILMAGAAYLRTRREFAILILGLSFTVCIEAVYALKQRYLGGDYRVPGTLDHANSLSMYLVTVAPLLLAAAMANWDVRLRWIAGIGCIAATFTELLTISRAGMPIMGLLILGVALSCSKWNITRQKVIIVLTVSAVMTITVVKLWDRIKDRYAAEASLADEYLDTQIEGRGVYIRWAKMIVDEHPFGVGLNNWSYVVSKTYGVRQGFFYEDYDDIKVDPDKADLPSINYAAPAHSLLALTAGELGIPGVIIFGVLWLRWFSIGLPFFWRRLNPDPMHRLGIGCFFATCGIFAQSVTEWTFRQSTLFLVFYMLMGGLASLHYARRHKVPEVVAEEVEAEEFDILAPPLQVSAVAPRR